MEVTCEPIEVLALRAEQRAEPVKAALLQLQSSLSDSKQRSFYGLVYPEQYYICATRLPGDTTADNGLEPITIPGGVYLRGKLMDGQYQPALVTSALEKLVSGHLVDHTRPVIQHFKDEQTLILYAPARMPLL